MGKLMLNDISYSGGGGGGSDVDITPTIQSGTKIADFEVDGVSGELYAPMIQYSNTEQAVGTWVDGRTIYQKTITKSFSTTASSGNYIYYGNIDYTSDFDITDWTNTYMNAILDKSFLTLNDGTVRNIWYVDFQNNPSIAFMFPFANRTGQLTVTFQYVKGDDLT